MNGYGHRLIETLFKRRSKRTAICAELASRSEADSDRSDIRVFEAGLSAQRYGDYEQGKGNAAQETKIYFIDPIIKLKKPAIEVLEYYYSLLK